MPELCFITTCKGRLSSLRQSLPAAAGQPRSSCIVVDYSCPDQSGDWVERKYPQVKVIRVPGMSHFQASHARNLAAKETDSQWLCFFDSDIVFGDTFSESVLELLLPGRFYNAKPWKPGLGGTYVCARKDFEQIEGFDEVIHGWGCEDIDLYERLRLSGLKRATFPADWIRQLEHDESARVRYFDVKNKDLSHTINRLYSQAKIDVMMLCKEPLPIALRQTIYDRVTACVHEIMATKREATMHVQFRRNKTRLGLTATGELKYTIRYDHLQNDVTDIA